MGDYSGHECPTCTPSVQLDTSNGQRVLAHIGSHVLHDPSIDRSQEPCGLCLRPALLCSIYLTKRGGRTSQWSIKYGGSIPCPNATTFSYATAMSSSKASPCSNVPLVCPYCLEGSPAVWHYNMSHHLQQRHRGIDHTKHSDLWNIKSDEMAAMAEIWKTRHKQPKRRGKGKQKLPLKVSEAHSSLNLTRYVKYAVLFSPRFTKPTSYIVHEENIQTDSGDESEGVSSSQEGCEDNPSKSGNANAMDTNTSADGNLNEDGTGDLNWTENRSDIAGETGRLGLDGVQMGGANDDGSGVLALINKGNGNDLKMGEIEIICERDEKAEIHEDSLQHGMSTLCDLCILC